MSEWSRKRSRWLQWYIMGLALTRGWVVATVGAGQEDADSDGSHQRYTGMDQQGKGLECLTAGTGGRVGVRGKDGVGERLRMASGSR